MQTLHVQNFNTVKVKHIDNIIYISCELLHEWRHVVVRTRDTEMDLNTTSNLPIIPPSASALFETTRLSASGALTIEGH